MLNQHYLDISVDDQLNAGGIIGRVLYRLHGFLVSQEGKSIAVDFPEWRKPAGVMAASLGRILRLVGDKDTLSTFLMKTGLIQFLIEGGIVVTGLRPVPADVSQYAIVSRNSRIARYSDLLKDPKKIRFDEDPAAGAEYGELASQLAMSPGLVAKMDQLMQTLHADKRRCASVKVQSQSSGKPFIMNIERDVVSENAGAGKYSTYGLSVEGACVPCW